MENSGAGNHLGPYRGRTTAVGGTISYTFNVAGAPISTRLKDLFWQKRAEGWHATPVDYEV